MHSRENQSKAPAAASSKSFLPCPLKGDDLWPSRSAFDAPFPLDSKQNTAKAMPRMRGIHFRVGKPPVAKWLQDQSVEATPDSQAVGGCRLARAGRPHHYWSHCS